jgi:CheY-like chemotaxis protein
MDGYELARRFRDQDPSGDLRLIALTGYGLESDRARARAAGFDLHLVKPVTTATLESTLETCSR